MYLRIMVHDVSTIRNAEHTHIYNIYIYIYICGYVWGSQCFHITAPVPIVTSTWALPKIVYKLDITVRTLHTLTQYVTLRSAISWKYTDAHLEWFYGCRILRARNVPRRLPCQTLLLPLAANPEQKLCIAYQPRNSRSDSVANHPMWIWREKTYNMTQEYLKVSFGNGSSILSFSSELKWSYSYIRSKPVGWTENATPTHLSNCHWKQLNSSQVKWTTIPLKSPDLWTLRLSHEWWPQTMLQPLQPFIRSPQWGRFWMPQINHWQCPWRVFICSCSMSCYKKCIFGASPYLARKHPQKSTIPYQNCEFLEKTKDVKGSRTMSATWLQLDIAAPGFASPFAPPISLTDEKKPTRTPAESWAVTTAMWLLEMAMRQCIHNYIVTTSSFFFCCK